MDSSPLARLPRELRDIIYAFVFTSPYAVTLQQNHTTHPLTKICSQLRRETLCLYFSLTRFNAHLDDGPATPLAHWLAQLGPELAVRVEEINVWDLHMLNATLHGTPATSRLLSRGREDGKPYVLQAADSWYLNEVGSALSRLGLSLERLCIQDEEAEEGSRVKMTSEFAIVRRD